MNLYDWYYRQIVSQGELDQAFTWAEDADHYMVADCALYGAISGYAVTETSPTPTMEVQVSGPGIAYDKTGERLYMTGNTDVDCSVDEYGASTSVGTSGNERWLSVFARFVRREEDPAVDGNSVTVYTKQYEDMELFVRKAAEASSGTGSKPPLMSDAILLGDIILEYNQTSVVNADINLERREDFIREAPSNYAAFAFGTAKAAISDLLTKIDNLAGGSTILYTPGETWNDSSDLSGDSAPVTSVSEALDAIVYDLAQYTGSAKIGIAAHATTNGLYSFADGGLQERFEELAEKSDQHANADALRHDGTDVDFDDTAITAINYPASTSLQTAIDNIATTLAATSGTSGGDQVGIEAVAGSPESFAGGTLQTAISEMYGHINDRVDGTDDEDITGDWTFSGVLNVGNGIRGQGIAPTAYGYGRDIEDFIGKDFGTLSTLAAPAYTGNRTQLSATATDWFVGPVIIKAIGDSTTDHYIACIDDQLTNIYKVHPYTMALTTTAIDSITIPTGTFTKITAICATDDGLHIFATVKVSGGSDRVVKISVADGSIASETNYALTNGFSDYGSDYMCAGGGAIIILCGGVDSDTVGVIAAYYQSTGLEKYTSYLSATGSFDTHVPLSGLAYNPIGNDLVVGTTYTAGENHYLARINGLNGIHSDVYAISSGPTDDSFDVRDICWTGVNFMWVTKGGTAAQPQIQFWRPSYGNHWDAYLGNVSSNVYPVTAERGGAICFDGINVWATSFFVGIYHYVFASPMNAHIASPSRHATEELNSIPIFGVGTTDWEPEGDGAGQIKYGKMISNGQHTYFLHAGPGVPPLSRRYLYRLAMSTVRGGAVF